MSRFFIDWERIRDNYPEGGELSFFVLPSYGRDLLLSISDRLRWQSTYGEFAIDDELQDIVDKTIFGLLKGEKMTTIADAIMYLADNLELVVTNTNENTNDLAVAGNSASGCCGSGGTGGGETIEDDPTGFPESDIPIIFEEELDVATSSPAASSAYMCDLGAYLADSLKQGIEDTEAYFEGVSVTIDLAVVFLQEKFPPGAVVPFVASLIIPFILSLEAIFLGNKLEKTVVAVTNFRDEFECAIASSTSGADAKQRWWAVLAELRIQHGRFPYTPLAIVSKWFNWDLIAGCTIPIPASYVDSSCCGNDNGSFDPISGYKWIKLPVPPAAAVRCDVDGSSLSSSGNEDGMQIDRIIGTGGLSVFGWDDFPIPANLAGVGFEFGSVSYVGTSEQGYGFNGEDLGGAGCVQPTGLQIYSGTKVFLECTDNPNVGNVGDFLRDNTSIDTYAPMDYTYWDSFGIYRNTAVSHENHVQITSIRFLVKD